MFKLKHAYFPVESEYVGHC